MEGIKRERSANFASNERDILVSLVHKYKAVLENKQSDASTWKKKEAAWKDIENEFNARSGGIFRSTKTLKIKYEGLKRTVRKKSAAIRSELYRTGGGKNTAPPLDVVEEQIKSLITLNTEGLESIFDCDVLPPTQENQDNIDVSGEKDPFCVDGAVEMIESVAKQNKDKPSNEETACILMSEQDVLPTTSKKTLLDDEKSLNATPTSANKKWDVTSRMNLKTRKHPALIVKSQRKNFDELTEAKLELVQLQKELLETEILEKKKEWAFKEKERKWKEEEILEKKKEWAFKEKERKWKEEEYILKLEKLRKELNELSLLFVLFNHYY